MVVLGVVRFLCSAHCAGPLASSLLRHSLRWGVAALQEYLAKTPPPKTLQ